MNTERAQLALSIATISGFSFGLWQASICAGIFIFFVVLAFIK